jgi:hypothetical protein
MEGGLPLAGLTRVFTKLGGWIPHTMGRLLHGHVGRAPFDISVYYMEAGLGRKQKVCWPNG